MKNLFLIFTCLLTSTTVLYGNEEDDSYGETRSKKFGMGVSFGVAPQTNFINFEFESPSWGILKKQIYLGAYFDATTISIKNSILGHDSPFRYNQNVSVSSGLVAKQYINELLASFIKVGPNLLWQSSNLSSQIRNWGWQASFGGEILYTRQSVFDVSEKWEGAFFSEITIMANNARADKVRGSPHLFDYVGIALGVRSYF